VAAVAKKRAAQWKAFQRQSAAASAVLICEAMKVLIQRRHTALETLPTVDRSVEWQIVKQARASRSSSTCAFSLAAMRTKPAIVVPHQGGRFGHDGLFVGVHFEIERTAVVECAFSKMARTFRRHIRVSSKDDLKERMVKGIAEINVAPVVIAGTSSTSAWLDMSVV
jgi:hypothetical protein